MLFVHKASHEVALDRIKSPHISTQRIFEWQFSSWNAESGTHEKEWHDLLVRVHDLNRKFHRVAILCSVLARLILDRCRLICRKGK